MSDSQAYEEVHKSSDGVTVTKRFEEDEFPVPAIAFEFVSERGESVTVTLSDEVPESVAVEDLGFHPEYGSEYWTIDEDQITFERELDPNAEYTTVYGIRATGTDEVEKFLTEPVLEEVDPPLPEDESDGVVADDVVPESDDDVVKDVISGDGEVPGLEDEDDSGAAEEDIETLDLKDPNAENEATTVTDSGGSESADGATDGDGETADVSVDDSVVAAMAAEIRQDDVPVDDLKLLQRAIDKLSERDGASASGGGGGGARDARVEKIQSDISDLRAYTDALEEFLEENGTGEQLIEEFQTQLDEFEGSLDAMQSELSQTSETVEEVRDEMDDVTEEVDTARAEVDAIGDEVDDLERSLADVESTVEELEEEVTEGDVADRIDEIEEELDDLQEWQNQIKSTFGG